MIIDSVPSLCQITTITLDIFCGAGVGIVLAKQSSLNKPTMIMLTITLAMIIFGVHQNTLLEHAHNSALFLLVRTICFLVCIALLYYDLSRGALIVAIFVCLFDGYNTNPADVFWSYSGDLLTFKLIITNVNAAYAAAGGIFVLLMSDIFSSHRQPYETTSKTET